jgi:AcrR family transcriptional regulator
MLSKTRLSRVEAKEQMREDLIEAAHHVFLANGYKAASLQQICEQASCTTGAIYSNFAGKEDLFFAVVERHNHKQQRLWRNLKERIGAADFHFEEFGNTLVAALPNVEWQDAQAEFRAAAVANPETAARLKTIHLQSHHNVVSLLEQFFTTYHIEPPRPYNDLAVVVRALMEGLLLYFRLDKSTPVAALFTASMRDLMLPFDQKDRFP